MYRILHKRILNSLVEEMVIHAPYVADQCQPGQFLILRVDEEGERIPLTIVDFDRQLQTVTIVYQIAGFSTHLLSTLQQGDSIHDVLGPLGQPADLSALMELTIAAPSTIEPSTSNEASVSRNMPVKAVPAKKILGIGGGVGAAPLYPQLRALSRLGASVDVILGGRNEEFILLADEFSAFCQNVHLATDDGSAGRKGFVTDVLKDLLENENYCAVIAIGPLMMMKAVCDMTLGAGIHTSVSLNPVMVDGTGMCGGCRVTVDGKVKFACVDGPDFDGHQVDFDECIRRQGMYREEEHICRLRYSEPN
ncbi:MAG: ferredoxin-NADP reductase [Candidatus Wallbacteria bacterium HGW-Wallbacteria-1]|jgi:NAD(P)H-flavin reductase|uniref:Ferredoxin-NADP reductase n=1 Tax=Candidatus Wallbacteria bacterium HGW-Wallbacteria-1 TaxID=2013854 RepID=A0A2N1PIJ3_9BACT|nr:MAG: ferredoxin-NADP reductase [Candidatus Wallbacteria bacterium HGW-Wallbacteria-1]